MSQSSKNQPEGLPRLYIAGTGMITPAGGNTAMTVAAVRAGVSRYQSSNFYNSRDKPMITTTVPDEALPALKEDFQGLGLSGREKRIIRLGSPAMKEVFSSCQANAPIPLFLAGPEVLPGNAKPVTAKMLRYLSIQSELEIDAKASRYFATGRAGVLEAIGLAIKYFAATDTEYVIVGGVDSYLDVATLAQLDSESRVLAEGANNGAAPGEGAAFLLLKSPKTDAEGLDDGVFLHEPGFGVEKGHRYSEEAYRGQGLADAVRAAVQPSGSRIATIYSSLNGDHFFAKEFGVATMRNSQAFLENCTHQHPADCYGDLGAATGAVLLALARHELMTRATPSQSLVYCSSDLASRAAVCLENRS